MSCQRPSVPLLTPSYTIDDAERPCDSSSCWSATACALHRATSPTRHRPCLPPIIAAAARRSVARLLTALPASTCLQQAAAAPTPGRMRLILSSLGGYSDGDLVQGALRGVCAASCKAAGACACAMQLAWASNTVHAHSRSLGGAELSWRRRVAFMRDTPLFDAWRCWLWA